MITIGGGLLKEENKLEIKFVYDAEYCMRLCLLNSERQSHCRGATRPCANLTCEALIIDIHCDACAIITFNRLRDCP